MELRPYQFDIIKAVSRSVNDDLGLTFSVEIARQGGKNETSAVLQALLLAAYCRTSGTIVKCSPIFKPQALISMRGLKDRLDDFGFAGQWQAESGYIIYLGLSRVVFLSADESASVVGHTADMLLEVDEAQDVSKDKYAKDFRPMGAAANVTTVLYGTTWDDSTLLEQVKQANLELERRDGVKRHFRCDWQEVARHNPGYLAFVEAERQRLGDNHPLFLTQYALLPIHGGGRFLSPQQIARLQGDHLRLRTPSARQAPETVYVAGIDLAGEAEHEDGPAALTRTSRDATVVTIAGLDTADIVLGQPRIRVVEHYAWTGTRHPELYARMVDILKIVWKCHKVVVDSTGMGEPVASFLRHEVGSRVVPFRFTQSSKSELGFNLLAAVNCGRLKLYRQDGSDEHRQLMLELERARQVFRPNQTLNFYVDPDEGHDDFLMSLALVVEAAGTYRSGRRRAVRAGSERVGAMRCSAFAESAPGGPGVVRKLSE
ncbi:MAG: hypothetical protein V1737_03930 [Chloroflexota bacterium]